MAQTSSRHGRLTLEETSSRSRRSSQRLAPAAGCCMSCTCVPLSLLSLPLDDLYRARVARVFGPALRPEAEHVKVPAHLPKALRV